MAVLIRGHPVVAGGAQGLALVSDEALSFWGGYDQHTGEIIDRRHPLSGQNGAGMVLAIPFNRGSSTTTAVLLEAIRLGRAPAAILTTAVDSFFALASIVAEELYAITMPVVALSPEDHRSLENGQWLIVHPDGRVEVHLAPPDPAA